MGMKIFKGNAEKFKRLDALWAKIAEGKSDEESGITKIKNKTKK